ncbi:hypothetical protein P4C99_00685 [Pontiellaceae bacterium B1224]|nr:hypothetical protein [Pontiellaceae bacterium B1224]
MKTWLMSVIGLAVAVANVSAARVTGITSLAELAEVAAKSGQNIKMKPGVYRMEDYLTPAVISNTVSDPVMGAAMISFSGSGNTFDFTGVTIEVNTELLNAFGGKVMEFYVTGSNNRIGGLTVTDLGNAPTGKGGQSFVVDGKNNEIRGVTLNMSGSSPYGYGDLIGKGGGSLVRLQKHSGMLVTGLNIKILDCSIYSRSFGHLFFVQGGRNVYFENCYAEAVTRTTDEMLAETEGPAFDVGFEAVYKNYNGEKVITPGYTKSLSECGFRNYGTGGAEGHKTGAMRFVNCRAKNCRIGFALSKIEGDILVQDCEATGCEAGYNLDGVTVENSRGDAVNGPLLYLNAGDPSIVDLALMPEANTTTVHAVATIAGEDHVVTLKPWRNMARAQELPILVGATRPAGCNPFSPLGTRPAKGITLNNETGMPVEIGRDVSFCTITSIGPVTDNGSGNSVSNARGLSAAADQ